MVEIIEEEQKSVEVIEKQIPKKEVVEKTETVHKVKCDFCEMEYEEIIPLSIGYYEDIDADSPLPIEGAICKPCGNNIWEPGADDYSDNIHVDHLLVSYEEIEENDELKTEERLWKSAGFKIEALELFLLWGGVFFMFAMFYLR